MACRAGVHLNHSPRARSLFPSFSLSPYLDTQKRATGIAHADVELPFPRNAPVITIDRHPDVRYRGHQSAALPRVVRGIAYIRDRIYMPYIVIAVKLIIVETSRSTPRSFAATTKRHRHATCLLLFLSFFFSFIFRAARKRDGSCLASMGAKHEHP